MDFTSKTVIVTGSARGIGLAITKRFSDMGANVVISDIDQKTVEEVAAEFKNPAIGIKINSSGNNNSLIFDLLKCFGLFL